MSVSPFPRTFERGRIFSFARVRADLEDQEQEDLPEDTWRGVREQSSSMTEYLADRYGGGEILGSLADLLGVDSLRQGQYAQSPFSTDYARAEYPKKIRSNKMRIGIISKPEHAKVHETRLRQSGHEVTQLGSSPVLLPPTLDVIVCRVASCSHAATDVAMREKRLGRRPVIFEDGVTGILREIEALSLPMNAPTDQPVVVIPIVPTNISNVQGKNNPIEAYMQDSQKVVVRAIEESGMFFARVKDLPIEKVIEALVTIGHLKTLEQKERACQALSDVQKYALRTIYHKMQDIRDSKQYKETPLW